MSACKYCSDVRSELSDGFDAHGDGVSIEMSHEDGPWRIMATGYYDGGYICGVEYVQISYCPMCGRKLDEEG